MQYKFSSSIMSSFSSSSSFPSYSLMPFIRTKERRCCWCASSTRRTVNSLTPKTFPLSRNAFSELSSTYYEVVKDDEGNFGNVKITLFINRGRNIINRLRDQIQWITGLKGWVHVQKLTKISKFAKNQENVHAWKKLNDSEHANLIQSSCTFGKSMPPSIIELSWNTKNANFI